MSRIVKISEAVSLALHGTALLAGRPERIYTIKEVASVLRASQAHLHKVFQRLARVGLLKSHRGPKGGYKLGRPGDQITLLEIYEAIEGSLTVDNCLFDTPICESQRCIFGDLLGFTNKRYQAYLEETKLSELTDLYAKEGVHEKRHHQDR
jgi:Rrf2 family protein